MNDYKHLYKVALVEYAKFSTCDRLKVAALLVHDGRILSCGYNGVPSGDQHCCDKFSHDNHGNFYIDGEPVSEEVYRFKHHEFSEVDEVRAEVNCLSYALKNHVDVSKCTLVVSIAPCSNCAKFILASGIKTVYYVDLYDRSDAGIEFLKKHNITVEKI